ncbi:eukaryotic translation initiation factor 4E-1A-like [Centruroides vittatus]|uniref:eukaryotic translation initiation factor 4E-1A-like n=1 Tax=Centruroides vittatus TaxID=120091 RepID=UPI00350F6A9B
MSTEQSQKESEKIEKVIKHRLQHKWNLWFHQNDKNKLWEESLVKLSSFDTVEDFWSLFNHIILPSNLPVGSDYSIFKDEVKPMWEDERNVRGGRWLINVRKHLKNSSLDDYWLETLLCLIGEAFDEEDNEVCGAVINIRKYTDKIGVWTSNSKNSESNIKIGWKLKERLNIRDGILGYEAHADTQAKLGSAVPCLYQV